MTKQPTGRDTGNTPPAAAGPREPGPGGGSVRRIAFRVVVALTLAFLLLAMLAALPLVVINWLPADAWLAARPDRVPGDHVHRLHSLALGVLAWGMVAGVGLQLHRPRQKVAALLVAVAVPVAIAAAEALAGTFTVIGTAPFLLPLLLVCALHPAARELVRPPRLDRAMTVLALVAAPAWIAYAVGTAGAVRATDTPDDADHLQFVASVALLAVLWGLIAATDKAGWRVAALATLLLTAAVALQSLVFPTALSGLPPLWAWAALGWCLAFGAAAWQRARADTAA